MMGGRTLILLLKSEQARFLHCISVSWRTWPRSEEFWFPEKAARRTSGQSRDRSRIGKIECNVEEAVPRLHVGSSI